MGCYNIYGYLSNMPILENDPVICFIGLRPKNIDSDGDYLIPIYFPLYGTYNDYGSVNFQEDAIYKYLTEKIGMTGDELIRFIRRHNPDKDAYHELISNIFKYSWEVNYIKREYKLSYTIEHRDVFETIASFGMKDAQKSYELSVENEHLLKDYYQYELYDKLSDGLDKDMNDAWSKSRDSLDEYILSFKPYQKYGCVSNISNINPNIEEGYFSHWRNAMHPAYLLSVIRRRILLEIDKDMDFWKKDEWKEIFLKTMSFWMMSVRLDQPVTFHKDGGQWNNIKYYKKLLTCYRKVLNDNNKRRRND